MRALILATALVLTPLISTAAEPPSPAVVAAARSAGDVMVADASAGGQFTNTTNDDWIHLRHNESGVTCLFDPKVAGNEVAVITDGGVLKAQCGVTIVGTRTYTYLEHYDGPITPAELLAANAAAFKSVHGDAVQISSGLDTTAEYPSPDLAPVSAVFHHGDRKDGVFTLITIARRNGWMIKVVSSIPGPDGRMAVMWGSLSMRGTLKRIDEGGA